MKWISVAKVITWDMTTIYYQPRNGAADVTIESRRKRTPRTAAPALATFFVRFGDYEKEYKALPAAKAAAEKLIKGGYPHENQF